MHNVAAPAFQSVFVQPDEKDDGIIHAYELLRLDLHHLDLVTLSACETALGRFDTADNPRGIPAALLIAGVRTIVASLWNVESNAATKFFETFYNQLQTSKNKLEAFYTAQTETRKLFPAYRDWGAFQMIGDWR
jgi:CHAT domain-containing protein